MQVQTFPLTPERKRLTVPREMDSLEAVGPALRALRKAAGLTQQQLADDSKVGFSMISGYERGSEKPQLATLLRLLDAMGLDLFALAEAMDVARGRVPPVRSGAARAAWVGLFLRNGVEPRTLEGAAAAALTVGDPRAEADLIASAEEAARQMALEAVAAVRRAELSLVAESPSHYDDGGGKK
jgi:transcriptional regulator with XRE-family HTH domain